MTLEIRRALPGSEVVSYSPPTELQPGQFRARAVSYCVADTYGTVWEKGVFTDSLKRELPTVCWGHDLSRPIGRVVSTRETPEGLEFTARLADPEAVPDAKMAHSLFSDGIVTGVSVGFRDAVRRPIPASERRAYGDLPARERIVRAHLGEISAVVAPSVPGAKLLAVRRAGLAAGMDEAAIIQIFARHLGMSSADDEQYRIAAAVRVDALRRRDAPGDRDTAEAEEVFLRRLGGVR